MNESLKIDVVLDAKLCLASQQNALPLIQRLSLTNTTAEPLVELTVEIFSDPAVFTPVEYNIKEIRAGGTWFQDGVDLAQSVDRLRHQTETEKGQVCFRIKSGEELVAEHREDFEVLAPTHWPGLVTLPELLSAWVLPNHPALRPVLIAAADRLRKETDDGALNGYQSRDPNRVRDMTQAIYDALAATGVRYTEPPPSFEEYGQKIALPNQVVGGLGTCLDLALLMAGCLERIGLHPLIFLVRGHAFVGVWLNKQELPVPVQDTVEFARSRVDLHEILAFDSSPVAQQISFRRAVDLARKQLNDSENYVLALDIKSARSANFHPLSLGAEHEDKVVTPKGPIDRSFGGFDEFDVRAIPELGARSVTRLQRWKDHLLDLTLRNRLLNFKPQGRKNIGLDIADPAGLEDEIIAGRAFTFAPKSGVLGREDPRNESLLQIQESDETHIEWLRKEQTDGRIRTELTKADLGARLLEVFRQSKTAFEESGAITLYLAIGFLRWFESESSDVERFAPIILVPVLLRRKTGDTFDLSAAPDETRVNVTLLKKLEKDFGLSASGFGVLPEDESGTDVPEVFRRFRRLVANKTRWEVQETCFVGQFSFTKFLMWLDLEAKTEDLLENEFVRHLFEGKGEAFLDLDDDYLSEERVDERPVLEITTVVDADPTQLSAIFAAESGANFVLQGPPGTGKSQTITNMIGQLLGGGKSVLFVSQKMAALEVVHNRLQKVGLGEFCLELHSHKSSKRSVLDQFQQALDAVARGEHSSWPKHASKLQQARDELNGFAALLRAPTPLNSTCFQVLSRLIAHRKIPTENLRLESYSDFNTERYERMQETGALLSKAVRRVQEPQINRWRGVQKASWTPMWEREVASAVADLIDSGGRLEPALKELESALEIDGLHRTQESLDGLSQTITSLLKTPKPPKQLVYPDDPEVYRAETQRWEAALKERNQKKKEIAAHFEESFFELDLLGLTATFRKWAGTFFLFSFFMLWSPRRRVLSHSKRSLPDNQGLLQFLESANRVMSCETVIREAAPRGRSLYGKNWNNLETETSSLLRVLDWAVSFRRALLKAAPGISDLKTPDSFATLATDRADLLASPSLRGTLEQTQKAIEDFVFRRKCLSDLLDLNTAQAWGTNPTLGQIVESASTWVGVTAELRDWCKVQECSNAASDAGIATLVELIMNGKVAVQQIETVLDKAILTWWWENFIETEPRFNQFRGTEHSDLIHRFRTLDKEAMELSKAVIHARLCAQVPSLDQPGEEPAILRRQLGLKRGHKSLRKLFKEIPVMFKRLKPCVLMSPLSVAQYLDPSLGKFDVVIFDEASQIPPWDAVGAIARGTQVVIVGDSKQLPPTTFFGRSIENEDDLLEDEDMAEVESILEEAVASGLQQRLLGWHYRSRHESLITFSNHHYYDGRLHTFPSPGGDRALGVEHVAVPEGFYDRGGSRTNKAEAEAVVKELLRLLRAESGRIPSVGIVTFSRPQQRLIEDLIDKAILAFPEITPFFSDDVPEKVFVKNLENVQGDERDVMLFSVCYGPDRSGKVTMNFGPLNRVGGERRLNVAITRAKERTVVFSTLRTDQIDLRRCRAVGVAHLKTYLDYAKRGMAAIDAALSQGGGKIEGPFEKQVKQALEEQGWSVVPQVGCSGYRIDLAVLDKKRPGRYLLGIECDGATYHSSRCARERDLIRETVLRGLGWEIHRIWSTDWWLNPDEEIEKLIGVLNSVEALPVFDGKEAVRSQTNPIQSTESKISTLGPSDKKKIKGGRKKVKHPVYQVVTPFTAGETAALYDAQETNRIGGFILEYIKCSGPISKDEVWRQIAKSYSVKRIGNRVRVCLEAALKAIPTSQRPVLVEDKWLWPCGLKRKNWREFRVPNDRAETQRKIDRIPPEELANAARFILKEAIGWIEKDDLTREVAKLFGIKRMGDTVRGVLLQTIDRIVVCECDVKDGKLRIKESKMS
jgi:very-short-patch-repair endonuclease